MPMPSPKKRLSTKGPPEKAQQSPESVPLIQNAERDGVAEDEIDLALAQGAAQRVVVGIGVQLGVGEHRLEIGLMRRARRSTPTFLPSRYSGRISGITASLRETKRAGTR